MSHQHEHAGSHDSGHGHADHGHSGDGHGGRGHSDHHDQPPTGYRPHHDWKVWIAVIWMLIGMAFYVLSADEQKNPNGEPAVPAAAE
jgi:hypothetical protein